MSDVTDNRKEGRKPYDLFGAEFGRYHVGKELGQGGYARVYRALEPEIEREVALKILLPGQEGAYSEKLRKRFLREAKLVARLKDHHTIKLYDYGEEDGLLYLAFEYVEGETLGERLGREGVLKPFMVAKLLEQLLDSLKEAHDLGILHRDIKPGNIMLYEHERRGVEIKVLDFGIGKFVREQKKYTQLTAEGRMIGTPRYMSPEQMRGSQDLGPGCDLWAVGMVAYECLTGTPAIETDDAMAMTTRILDDTPFELPQEVEAPKFMRDMVSKLLRKDQGRRYQNAGQVLEDLEEFRTKATVELQEGALREKFEAASSVDSGPQGLEASAESDTEDATPGERPSARKNEGGKPAVASDEGEQSGDRGFNKNIVMALGAVVVCLVGAMVFVSGDGPSEEVPAFLEKQEKVTAEHQGVPAALEQREDKEVVTAEKSEAAAGLGEREQAEDVEMKAKETIDESAKTAPVRGKNAQDVENSPSEKEQRATKKEPSEKKKAPSKKQDSKAKEGADEKEQAGTEVPPDTEETPEAAAGGEPEEDAEADDDTELRVWGVE